MLRQDALLHELAGSHLPQVHRRIPPAVDAPKRADGKSGLEVLANVLPHLEALGADGGAHAAEHVPGVGAVGLLHLGDHVPADAPQRPPPPGVAEADGPFDGIEEIEGHAVRVAGDQRDLGIVGDKPVAGWQALPGIAPAPILSVHLQHRDPVLVAVHDHGILGEPGPPAEAAVVLHDVGPLVVGEAQVEPGEGGLADAADPGGKAVIDLRPRRKSRQGIDAYAPLLPVGMPHLDAAECCLKGCPVHHAPAFSSRSRCSSSMKVWVSLNSL